jgi:hypothetical protein
VKQLQCAGVLSLLLTALSTVPARGQGRPPVFVTQPVSQIVLAGADVTFSVTLAASVTPLLFQWQKNNMDLPGATNATLVLTNVSTARGGDYAVVVMNAVGSLTSEAAGLTVVKDNSISGSLGGTATLRVGYTGPAPTSFQWRFNGADIPGATKATRSITNAQPADVGQYSVVVTGPAGSITSLAPPLVVDPTFTKINTGPVVTDQVVTYSSAWGDYDGDGLLDLVVVGDYFNSGPNTRLYHNDGNGQFTTVTNAPIGGMTDLCGAGAWVDLNNDGNLDLFLGSNPNQAPVLFMNQGQGQFARVPVKGVMGPVRGNTISFGDYDGDGFLDAFLGSYASGKSSLLHNNGDGTFTVVTNSILAISNAYDWPSAWVDYDNDGNLDLFALRQYTPIPSRLYRNDGQGHFVEATPEPLRSEAQYGLTAAWGDFDNDGYPDLFFGGYGNDYDPTIGDRGSASHLYLNNGDGTFTHWAGQPATLTKLGTGVAAWGDYDNDGYLDLFFYGYPRPCLFRNLGDGNFEEILTGSPMTDRLGASSSGVAWADYDNDGFLDLFVTHFDGVPNYLYHNNGNSNHWFKVGLKGLASNSYGVGARVFATATIRGRPVRQMRTITAQPQGEQLYAHFGLGDATNIDIVRIEWPSGIVQELHDQAPNQFVTVPEAGAGILPRWQALVVGSNLTFHASTTLTSPVIYQWQRYGTNLVGETNVTLTIPNAQAADVGEYTVAVSTADGAQSLTSAPVLLKWSGAPIIRVQPQSQIVAAGSDVTFSLDVVPSTVPPTFQWQGPFGDIVGATNATFTLTNLALNSGGNYTVIVSNPTGSLTSEAAGLTVVQDASISASLGGNATLWVKSGGAPPNSYQWRLNDVDISGATTNKYVLTNAQPADVGQYSVVVTSEAGSVTVLCLPQLVDPTFIKITTGPVVGPGSASGSACWGDVNNDGYLDLFVPALGNGAPHRLLINNGSFRFTALPADQFPAGVGTAAAGWGAVGSFGDYDNDGDLDLVIGIHSEDGTGRPLRFLRNEGAGAFVPVTNAITRLSERVYGCSWGDFNGDGLLDLFVGKRRWSGVAPNNLFESAGSGEFVRNPLNPVNQDFLDGLTGSWADYDLDGNLDLFVPSYAWDVTMPPAQAHNALYQNQGDGTLRRLQGLSLAGAYGPSGEAIWADYDNDGDLDVYITREPNSAGTLFPNLLFRNDGNGVFTRVLEGAPVPNPMRSNSGNGAAWGDYDNDGNLDLFVANGQTNVLYRNDGAGRFTRIPAGSLETDPDAAVTVAWVDVDRDGFLDLFLATSQGSNRLYRNNGFATGNQNHWIEIKCEGAARGADKPGPPGRNPVSNRDGIGAKIFVTAIIQGKEVTQLREITGGPGNYSTIPLEAHFGLGDATNVDVVRIEWPSGIVQELPNVGTNQFLTVSEQGVGILPRKQLALTGSNYTFRAATTLAGPVTYQWRFGTNELAGQTNATLTITGAQRQDTGEYSVLVSNGTESMTSESVVLYWPEPPVITQQPKSQIVVAGANATFTVAVALNPVPATFQWQQNTVDLAGATNATLLLTNVSTAKGGDYTVVVSNPAGSVTSDAAGLTVVQDNSVSASLGGNATLRIRYGGPPLVSYQWQFNGKDIAGATNASLTLTKVQGPDVGDYSVVVANAAGSVTSHAPALVVDPAFSKITTGPLVTDLGCSGWGAWADYDDDGYPDLAVSRYNTLGTPAIYHNNRDGTFARLPDLPSLKSALGFEEWGDWDNDGHMDLMFYRTDGTLIGFGDGQGDFSPTSIGLTVGWMDCAMADYDRDGLLDLYFTSLNRLYRNRGDRAFTVMPASEVGPPASVNTHGSACWGDFDDDGWPDLYVPSMQQNRSLMFRNEGTGRFVAVTNLVTKTTGPALAGAWGDYDNDGRLDLCVASWNGTTMVYRNLGDGEFERATGTPSLSGTHNFAAWADYDNDGFLDLFVSGGYTANALFRNNGDGTFTPITTGSIVTDLPLNGAATYSGLWFDYDNDGFLDLYVLNGDEPGSIWTANQLYHNNGNSNAWLTVRPIGTVSNRGGVGAKVRVLATYAGRSRWQRRDITAGGIRNGNHLYAHFGLGDATNVMTLRIEWPSGIVQELTNVGTKQFLTVTEPPGLVMPRPGELQVTAWSNMTHRIDASTNLVQWTPLVTLTNQARTAVFTDPDAASLRYRFYRAVKP